MLRMKRGPSGRSGAGRLGVGVVKDNCHEGQRVCVAKGYVRGAQRERTLNVRRERRWVKCAGGLQIAVLYHKLNMALYGMTQHSTV